MGASASTPAQITINSMDADVPIIPPIVLLALLAISALLAKFVDRFRWMPDDLNSLRLRLTLFMALFTFSVKIHLDALDEMHKAGSGLAFTPVAGIATEGPFAYSRNPFYTLLIFVQLPMLAMLFDSGWLLFSVAPMYVWLSKFVIPGEEAFLTRNFGTPYTTYMESTPRWLL